MFVANRPLAVDRFHQHVSSAAAKPTKMIDVKNGLRPARIKSDSGHSDISQVVGESLLKFGWIMLKKVDVMTKSEHDRCAIRHLNGSADRTLQQVPE